MDTYGGRLKPQTYERMSRLNDEQLMLDTEPWPPMALFVGISSAALKALGLVLKPLDLTGICNRLKVN